MYLLLHGMPLALRLVSLDPFLTICSGLFMITRGHTMAFLLPLSLSLSHSELFWTKKLQFKKIVWSNNVPYYQCIIY